MHRIGIIGLGVMGRRMLSMLKSDERFEVKAVWDINAESITTVCDEFPTITETSNAEAVISCEDVDLIYIATPPATHIQYAEMAIEHKKPILCEKPLAVDIDTARQLVEKVRVSGLPNAVNFVLASAPNTEIVQNAVNSGELGDILKVEMRFHFSQWPRAWQTAGDWLSERADGGYVREVVSHWVEFTARILKTPVSVNWSHVSYPDSDASENHVMAGLQCGEIPVHLVGGVGGATPDIVEWVLYGTKKSIRLSNWQILEFGTTQGWEAAPAIEAPMTHPHLDSISNLIKGEAHPLADFARGLRVQEVIETILAES